MNDAKTIGERLLKLRLSEKKTQKEVTEAIGISVSALTMYETGNRIPRDEIKVKLAHYYSTSVERLFLCLSVTRIVTAKEVQNE